MAKQLTDIHWNVDDAILDSAESTIDPITEPVTEPVTESEDAPSVPAVADKDEDGALPGISEGTTDSLYQFLKKRGIEDPSKIKFENEQGETEDHDFHSLTPEEQLTILDEITDIGLTEHETEVVNYLRQNNTTLDNVIDFFAEKRLQEYLETNPDQVHIQNYSIDDYSDDELYLADLKSKFSSFTDEELQEKLTSAKYNEELFKKEVDVLRQTYKTEEDQNRELEKQQEDQNYEDLKNNLVEAASAFNEISLDYSDPKSDSLVIEEEDKRQLLSYLLYQNTDGKSQFVKDLDDPQALIELAWFRTQGAEVISGITKYWKDILKTERKERAKLEKQIESSSKQGTQTVVTPIGPPKDGTSVPDYRSLGSKVNLK